MASGFYWYTDPGIVGQKFSVFADQLPDKIGSIVSEAVDEATQEMRQRISGLPRIRTGAMYSSISSSVSAGGPRVRANFGYIDSPPDYTKYQEFGTRYIPAAHAFVDAGNKLYANLKSKIDQEDIWSDLRF